VQISISIDNAKNKKQTPNYTKIKTPITCLAAVFTQNKLTEMMIKDEIKFLYKKEQKTNN
jgi:hypothetical protein